MPLSHTSKYAELTDEQFGIIGRIVVEWSNIEVLLGNLLSRLLFMPDFLGRTYSDEMNASRLQFAIQKAVEIHKHRYHFRIISTDTLDEISKLNAKIEKFRSTRNKFTHFCWWRSTDEEICGSGLSGYIRPSKHADKDFVTFSVGELRGIYKSAYELTERIKAVLGKLPEVDEEDRLKPTD